MTEETITKTWWQREGKALTALIGAVLVVAAALLIFNAVNENRERSNSIDSYYCVQAGIGPLDEAPSGKLCIDVD